MEEKKDRFIRNRFILYPLRGFVIALIPWFTHLFVYRHMKGLSEDLNLIAIDASLFFVFSLFILALIYNSFTLYFATYDREERDVFFLEDGGETRSFFGERKYALTKLSFWLELCSALLFTSFIVFLGGFGDIDYFVLALPVSEVGARAIGFLILGLYLFILLLDRRCEARKYWQQLNERNDAFGIQGAHGDSRLGNHYSLPAGNAHSPNASLLHHQRLHDPLGHSKNAQHRWLHFYRCRFGRCHLSIEEAEILSYPQKNRKSHCRGSRAIRLSSAALCKRRARAPQLQRVSRKG